MQKNIAVIGAGMSGLVAAHALAQAGHRITVFEKARGPGGRMSTRRREGHAFDHGAQYFTCRDPRFRSQIEAWLKDGVVAEWTAAIHVLNAGHSTATDDQTTRYVGVPRMSAIARHLAGKIEIVTRQRITELGSESADPPHWFLQSESGERYTGFDRVILSVPARQAVPLLAVDSGFQTRAQGVSMLPCHATLVTFSEELKTEFGGAFVENSPLSWVARNASKPDRPQGESWVLHSQADWSLQHMEDPPEAVAGSMLDALSEALGHALPEILDVSSHRWALARSEEPMEVGFLFRAETGLAVCGDWLHGDRVEGAFLSGLELAEALMESLSDQ